MSLSPYLFFSPYVPIFLSLNRRYRLRKLEFFSEVSQLLGQVESPLLCSVRDTCIYYVPQAIKGVVFDLFIQAVASSEATNKQTAHTSRRSKKRC